MSYPSQAELLAASPLPEWLDEHFLRPDPFAFREVDFGATVRLVARELSVDANGIFCIGSGAVGLSLNPGKVEGEHLGRFTDGSDIDLAVISEVHFETAWRDLRQATQPIFAETEIAAVVRANIGWQRRKFFDGAIIAHKLLPALSFGTEWQLALVRVGAHVATILNHEVDVNMWIYRDYWSLRNYVLSGLVNCRKELV